eukprot:gene14538-17184_t
MRLVPSPSAPQEDEEDEDEDEEEDDDRSVASELVGASHSGRDRKATRVEEQELRYSKLESMMKKKLKKFGSIVKKNQSAAAASDAAVHQFEQILARTRMQVEEKSESHPSIGDPGAGKRCQPYIADPAAAVPTDDCASEGSSKASSKTSAGDSTKQPASRSLAVHSDHAVPPSKGRASLLKLLHPEPEPLEEAPAPHGTIDEVAKSDPTDKIYSESQGTEHVARSVVGVVNDDAAKKGEAVLVL